MQAINTQFYSFVIYGYEYLLASLLLIFSFTLNFNAFHLQNFLTTIKKYPSITIRCEIG